MSDRELNRLHFRPRRSRSEERYGHGRSCSAIHRTGRVLLPRQARGPAMAVKPAGCPAFDTTLVLSTRGKPRFAFPNAVSTLANRRVSCGLSGAQWPVEIARRFQSVTAERSPALRHSPLPGMPRSCSPHRGVAIRPSPVVCVLPLTAGRSAVLSHCKPERLIGTFAPLRVPWSR